MRVNGNIYYYQISQKAQNVKNAGNSEKKKNEEKKINFRGNSKLRDYLTFIMREKQEFTK